MPSADDLRQWMRIKNSAQADDSQKLVANMPAYPPQVKERFPEMQAHEEQLKAWIKELIIALRGGQQ